MSFIFHKTDILDLIVVEPHKHFDGRGLYKKYYEKSEYGNFGIKDEFYESSDIHSHKGVIRGLHYQTNPSQSKLLHVIQGAIFDVAVDLRTHSKTYGKYHIEFLNKDNDKIIYIPEGFAHGFLALEDNTVFSYQCAGKYIPENCGGIRWDDKILNIKWPLHMINEVVISEKDKNLSSFVEFDKIIK